MLNRKYNIAIIGLNYVSLMKGIKHLQKGETVLIIDNEKYRFANNWCFNVGLLERFHCSSLGINHNIDSLKNFGRYLLPTNTFLNIDKIFVEASDSHYSSLKEIARKFPESFSKLFNEKLKDIDSEDFDERFTRLLSEIGSRSHREIKSEELLNYILNFDPLLTEIFNRFDEFVRENGEHNLELQFALQVLYQTRFSNSIDKLESIYLLLSFISPRYRVDHEALTRDLLFEFNKLGGDIKHTFVEDWGVENERLRYILLASVDGLIEVGHTYYFSQLVEPKNFKTLDTSDRFLSIKANCLLDHDFVENYANKRIAFLKKNRMGSDFPFWEISIDPDGYLEGTYTYADDLGSKPNFYFHQALDDLFESLQKILPKLDRNEWVSRTKLQRGEDLWLNKNISSLKATTENNVFDLNNRRISGLDYCGPEINVTFGFFGYLQSIFSKD